MFTHRPTCSQSLLTRSVVQSSRGRRSRRHRQHRPRHHASNATVAGAHTNITEYQTTQTQAANSTALNDSSVAHTSMPPNTSKLSYSASTPWAVDPAMTNNSLGSQHASSLQYLSAPGASSIDSNHQISYSYGQNGQAQWSALNNYANAPPRDDAWSPWVMPVQDQEVPDEATAAGEDEGGKYKEREEPS